MTHVARRLVRLSYLDEQGALAPPLKPRHPGVADLLFEYDREGRLLRVREQGTRGDLLGETRYVQVSVRAGGGRVVEALSLGPAGTPRLEPGTECARRRYELDALDRIDGVRFLNAYGAPTRNAEGEVGYGYRRGPDGRAVKRALEGGE